MDLRPSLAAHAGEVLRRQAIAVDGALGDTRAHNLRTDKAAARGMLDDGRMGTGRAQERNALAACERRGHRRATAERTGR